MSKPTENNIIEDLVESAATIEKAEEILRELVEASPGVKDNNFLMSLILSGAALGMEQMMRRTASMQTASLHTMRKFLAKLDSAIPQIDDVESLKVLTEIRDTFRDDLRQRAQVVRQSMVNDAWDNYRIPEGLLVSSTPASDIANKTLEAIGYKTFTSTPMLFAGWSHVQEIGGYARMKCSCPGCTISKLERPPEDMQKVIFDTFDRYGGAGGAFLRFGEYMLEQMRDALTKQMEGSGPDHEVGGEGQSPQAIMEAAMKALREGKPKDAPKE